MRLHIRPLSLWVAYTLTDPVALQNMLPPNLKLAPTRLLSTDAASPSAPKLLFNSYDVSSTFMKGHRLDIQTMAMDRETKTMHLVVLDCLSNVAMWDPSKGLQASNAQVRRRHTPESFGQVKITQRNRQPPCFLVHNTTSSSSSPIVPDFRFVVEANRECYFGDARPGYKMRFDEAQVMHPVRKLALSSVKHNTLWKSVRSPRPSHAFVHTSRMTFDVDVPELWYSDV